MKTDELREKYLEFFVSKGCVRRPSDVLVPRWDPSVLFTPAGMNPFKDHFLGKCKLEFTRAASCQKCLRTGDIDNVGRTAYHHTFFEMLGNFSFGDYFKRDAISWAWEFLTSKKWLGLNPAQLSVTVYLDDDEAYGIWADEIKIPAARIKRMGEDDNFWPAGAPSQGPDGVCGPCSEIFFHPPGGKEVEIWNLVFTQFNRVGPPPNNLRPLPSKNIDTGMGLERTASVMQGVDTNYHIDILRPLVEAAGEVCRVKYDPASDQGRRLRRIADHVRACTFAIHENVYPGANKEKYVIKRLLRRAVLDGRQMGLHAPFLHQLVPVVADLMKQPYPELLETTTRVARVIQQEEGNFFGTIDGGLDRTSRIFEEMKKTGRKTVSGPESFDMYSTHGFPPELFETLAKEQGFDFDWAGFKSEMEKHGEDSGGGKKGELFKSGPLDELKKTLHGTDFLGYYDTESPARVAGIIAGDRLVQELSGPSEQTVQVVLDQSPFYGESGGQVGDSGVLTAPGMRFEVTDSHRDGGFILHIGALKQGRLATGQELTATVDAPRRAAIRRAHSATHILHYALQKYLGRHAQQQGSKVDADWLRFDFSNPEAVPRDVLLEIDREANRLIMSCQPVTWTTLPIAEARKSGAMMLFGEKYPDIVRMVSMGDFSKELCGGTHLDNTGQSGPFAIVAEESVSAGTRRITALTGARALAHVREAETVVHEIAGLLKAPASEAAGRVAALVKEVRELKKQLAAGQKQAGPSTEQLLAGAADHRGVKAVVAEISGGTAQSLREQIDLLRRKAAPVAVLLGSREEGKVTIVAGISRDLQEQGLDAAQWIRSVAPLVGGSGGGRADMAQAGGKLPDKLSEALETARRTIGELLAQKV